MTNDPAPGRPQRARLLAMVAMGLWAVALVVSAAHVWKKPHAGTVYKDFEAGGARWLASQNLYPKVDEYIYSPFAAAFFAPFAMLPDRAGGILWRALAVTVYAMAFSAWLKRGRGTAPECAALAWIFLLPLSVGDVFNGQANPLVIGLLMLAVVECRREHWIGAALSVAFATYFKVYPLSIGLLLAVLHPRKFPGPLVLALAGIFVVSLVLQQPDYVLKQYGNWVHTLGQDPRRTLNYFGTYRDFWLLLRVLRVPISVQGWAILQALSGAGVAGWLYVTQRRGASAEQLDFLLLTMGTCWMLLFGPATESATYVIAAPPVVLASLRWRGQPRFLAGAIACYALLLGSQMLSSWGHQYQNAFTHLIQPLAVLIFAATLIASSRRSSSDFTIHQS